MPVNESGRSVPNGLGGVERIKLKEGFDFRKFLKKGEGSFTVDENALPSLSAEKEKEKSKADKLNYFKNCSLKNITVNPVYPEDEVENNVLSDFSTIERKFTNITEDGGLKKKVDRPGNGKQPPPKSRVWIYYTVYCEDIDEPVDTVYSRPEPQTLLGKVKEAKPFAFKLGNFDVLPALEIGVATMELREIAKFIADPKYAYGDLGLPNRVPEKCRVLFCVELVEFVERTAINAVFKMNAEERALVDFEELYKAANEMKVMGNRFCDREKDWRSAISKYHKGIRLLDRYLTIAEDIEKKRNDLLFVFYINIAQCYLQTQEYEKVVSMCRRALDLPPNTEGNRCKAFYRKAKAEFEIGRFEESGKSCKAALLIEPINPDIRSLFEQVTKRLSEDDKEERKLLKRMFSGLTIP